MTDDRRLADNREVMCRNIKTLFNFDPPATDEEIRAASLQFVRKLSGFNGPSKANEAAFNAAIDDVAAIARRLIDSLTTSAMPKNRDEEAAKARARGVERFASGEGPRA
jgi:hypothetical protein